MKNIRHSKRPRLRFERSPRNFDVNRTVACKPGSVSSAPNPAAVQTLIFRSPLYSSLSVFPRKRGKKFPLARPNDPFSVGRGPFHIFFCTIYFPLPSFHFSSHPPLCLYRYIPWRPLLRSQALFATLWPLLGSQPCGVRPKNSCLRRKILPFHTGLRRSVRSAPALL